ncbi:hypothetical protein DFP80_101274 [Marinomonas rhizomae]|uniref:Uncharacterized protein n=1 Tax=Marinomonas rhizomae TaxID=491948 RepID=A0A366JH57_9GAMM|nr:hypothetical protein DFP80_101274 [Marinomonas rhizomae]
MIYKLRNGQAKNIEDFSEMLKTNLISPYSINF